MRLIHLYLRSRLTGYALAYLTGSAAFAWLVARWSLDAPQSQGEPITVQVPMMIFMPLVAALVSGVGTYSPFGETEKTSSRSLPLLRLEHILILLVWAGATLAFAAVRWNQSFAELIVIRNLSGFMGISFFGAVLLGSRLSWIVPLSYTLLALFTGLDKGRGLWKWWAWPMQPGKDGLSLMLALVLLIVGLGSIALFGARDPSGEAE